MRPDFLDLMDYAHAKGMVTCISLTVAFALGSGAGTAALVPVGFRARRVLGASALTALLAAALLCMQRQWVLWSVSGMEITAAAFVLLASTLRLIQEAQRLDLAHGPHTPRAALRAGLGSGALFFLATLLRRSRRSCI